MVKIAIFQSYYITEQVARRAAKELNFELFYIETDSKHSEVRDYVPKLRWAEREGVDAILCIYSDYVKMQKAGTSIPLIPLYFTSWETLGVVQSLKKNVVDKQLIRPHKVALLTQMPITVDLQMLNEIFDLELHNVIRTGAEVSDEFFRRMKEEGYEVVACVEYLHDQVRKAGMLPAYDENAHSYTAVLEALREAMHMVSVSREISQRNHELHKMIDYSFEAVWIANRDGMITVHNAQARTFFSNCLGRAEDAVPVDYVGRSVFELLPEKIHDIVRDAFANGTNYYSHLMLHTKADGLFNINPVLKEDCVDLVIFHFTALQHLEQMEEQVKSEAYVKGHTAKYTFGDIIGDSAQISQAKSLARRFAQYESNILLLGESGTGKEMFAQSIHNASRRCNQAFVALNCGALPPTLLESELFGYVDGAFTGAARKGKKGLFEIADRGTIFLDEISEMDAQGQVRLLRVLEEHEIMRVGSDKVIPVDVRVVAASNKNLLRQVEKGEFREDLYYRLNVLTVGIPALNQRRGDIVQLARHFLRIFGEKYQKIVDLDEEASALLAAYEWPGNVRQLRNFCERMVIVADAPRMGGTFVREQLQSAYAFELKSMQEKNTACAELRQEEPLPAGSITGREQRECREILQALNAAQGNRARAAAMLEISKATLWRKIKKYHIDEQYTVT